MGQPLSGVTAVIFIALGVLFAILVFIFAKRQIVRFTLRSRRGPHVLVGYDAKKSLRKEIERRLDIVPRIIYEPKLVNNNLKFQNQNVSHAYRMKAVDSMKILEREIELRGLYRHPSEPLRSYLTNAVFGGVLIGSEQKIVQEYCDHYEHARYDPRQFGIEEFQKFLKLQGKLLEFVRSATFCAISKPTSPSRLSSLKNRNKKVGPTNKTPIRGGMKGNNSIDEDQTALCEENKELEGNNSKHETTV